MARMYDPETARFLQKDSYRGDVYDPLSLNLYAYCRNEPMMYTDPTGHSFSLIANAGEIVSNALGTASAGRIAGAVADWSFDDEINYFTKGTSRVGKGKVISGRMNWGHELGTYIRCLYNKNIILEIYAIYYLRIMNNSIV